LRAPPKNSSKKEKKVFLLGSARLRAGGGFNAVLGRGGRRVWGEFRRVLALIFNFGGWKL
jgi:hypothetical protein